MIQSLDISAYKEVLYMIIDRISRYCTEEEKQKIKQLEQGKEEIQNSISLTEDEELFNKKIDRSMEISDSINAVIWVAEQRYLKSRSAEELLEDVKAIADEVTKEDFQKSIAYRKELLKEAETISKKANIQHDETLDNMREQAVENYDNCYSFILSQARVPVQALLDSNKYIDKISAIIDKRISLWYVKPNPAYIPMAHGKATDALAYMSTRNAVIDRLTGDATIEKFGVQLAILKLKELHATLGISTDKLLSTAIATFTQQNDFRHTRAKEPKREDERKTNTPEEAEREKKRAKAQLDNARKAIKKDLDIIHASTLKWEEPIKGKSKDFARVSLVTYTGIQNGVIKIAFSPEIANYLAERNLITQYPTKLLGISGRQPTAYYIGRKLAEHYNIDSNQVRGTHNRISIPALLAVTDLPSFEEVQQTDRGHWENRIKRFFEEALDTLTQEGVLVSWEYTHAKGIPLTLEEAYNITSYEEFEKLYLLYELADKVDNSERIHAKQEARAKAVRKKRATKKKTKS